MELKEFIKTALIDIINGVNEAQDDIIKNSKAGRIVPIIKDGSMAKRHLDDVEFDIELGETKSNSGKAQIGVVLARVGIGGQYKRKSDSTQTSRVRFTIPITYPCHEDKTGESHYAYIDK